MALPGFNLSGLANTLAGFWSRWGGTGVASRVRLLLPGARLDYEREAGDMWMNSTVALGLKWVGDNYPRPKMLVSKRSRRGEYVPLPRHELVDLLRKPNPHWSGRVLAKAIALSLLVDGNAYLIKIRAKGNGKPVQLWWHPHWAIAPRWPTDGSQYISDYEVRVDGVPYYVRKEDVIHFRDGVDPRNERLGLAALRSQLRGICSDNETEGYTASILRNLGVPGLVITLKPGARRTDDQAERLIERFRDMHTGENRGDPLVMDDAGITQIGLSPEQLRLDKIPLQIQAKILASIGVPSMVVGLPDPNKTYSNLAEARRAAWENCLVPLQDLVAETLTYTLLPDLGYDSDTFRVEFDYAHVESLQEAQSLKSERIRAEWQAGVIQLNEARQTLGYEPDPDGDRWFPGTGGDEMAEADELSDSETDDQGDDDENQGVAA